MFLSKKELIEKPKSIIILFYQKLNTYINLPSIKKQKSLYNS